jgi:hypothetical protein
MALRYYPVIQFFDDSGDVLNGGKIYTYITGTSTNKATYQDQGQVTAHANPIVLDSDGRPPSGAIWLLGGEEYRFIIKTSDDVTLQTIDDLQGISSPISDINGYKHGLTLSNDTDTDHDILISTGVAMDSTNVVIMNLGTAITKQLDATWAVGDDAGGRASGASLSTSTWYHIHLIRASDGTVDAGFDTSVTAANLLTDSGYTYYRRIGSVLTDGSSNILQFIQQGDKFTWSIPVSDEANANPGTSAVTDALTTPTGVVSEADITFTHSDDTATTAGYGLVTPVSATDTTPSATLHHTFVNANGGVGAAVSTNLSILTNTSSQIRYRLSVSDADVTASIVTHGWREIF